MKSEVGMNFQRWCAKDADDTRKINYVLHNGGMEPETFEFTSDDYVDRMMMLRIRNSTIVQLELHNNEWFVELSY